MLKTPGPTDRAGCLVLLGGNNDLSHHAGLVVARDQAGEIERSRLVKGPDDFAGLSWRHVRHVGLVVFHVGKLHHQRRMFVQLLLGANDEFVQLLAIVLEHQFQGVALLEFYLFWRKTHGVRHCYLDGTFGGFCVSCNAPRFLFHLDWALLFCVAFVAMGEMQMPIPDQTLPMMTGTGPYGPVEMGGMFSMLKVRKDQKPGDYKDPGWFKQPAGTQAFEWTGAMPEPARFQSEGSSGNGLIPRATDKPVSVVVRKPVMNSGMGH